MKKIYEYTDYYELLKDLKVKYGVPQQSYFINDVNYSSRPKIKRSKEGLYIHHDREDTYIQLAVVAENRAYNYPFSVHDPENLTYCNYMEHLMLHVLICCGETPVNEELNQNLGIGGIVNYFTPQINVYLADAYDFKQDWLKTCLEVFDGDEGYETYIKCLHYLINNINPKLGKIAKTENLIFNLLRFDPRVAYDQEKAKIFTKKLLNDLTNY